ncbi:hypothetical protein RHGRI_033851 [Rhododendron griersonianum]|uniref:Uncharacterized protein n=1 Tax=Rhododendron griersonianum TaxID=479676 RepID=A0AAV6I2Q4_9ERIC|nr:hypothetical protein RHGRI_033851 [Rhododendron griersonianum]
MDSLSLISPSIVLPPTNPLRHQRRRRRFTVSPSPIPHRLPCLSSLLPVSYSPEPSGRRFTARGAAGDENDGVESGKEERESEEEVEEVERALRMEGGIPGTSNEFVERVSSRAYDMRRSLQQTFESSSYDVLETNPWRETSKPVYVLTHRENQLCTMKTRTNRSEVERELGLLFSKGENQMRVEDVREGVLVFEDEKEAANYCGLLEGGGQGCEGIAEIEASSVFDLCRRMGALAVLFRRGRTPPVPENLDFNLRARKQSLEDQEDII